MPVLLLLIGAVLDLGRYYLNVSRLQNAADAAALAGAQTIVKGESEETGTIFSDYYVVRLSSNRLPDDFDDYEDVYKNTFGDNETGTRLNYKKIDELQDTLQKGQAVAEEYTRKNLADNEGVSDSSSWKVLSATDSWSLFKKDEDKKVSGTIELKYKIIDGKNDVYGPLYYVVSLNEKIRHFFLPGWFEAMDAPVKAVVLLQPHNEGLITPI